jgi:hypothetical protein
MLYTSHHGEYKTQVPHPTITVRQLSLKIPHTVLLIFVMKLLYIYFKIILSVSAWCSFRCYILNTYRRWWPVDVETSRRLNCYDIWLWFERHLCGHLVNVSGVPRGIWGFKPTPKFRSFDKAEPNPLFRGKYIRNNLIRIRVSLICKLSGTPD